MTYFKKSVNVTSESASSSRQYRGGQRADTVLYWEDFTIESGSVFTPGSAENYVTPRNNVASTTVQLVSNMQYRIEYEAWVKSDSPIVLWKFYDPTDTTLLTTVTHDMYNGSSIYTNYFTDTFTLNYLTGVHSFVLRMDCTTKNASSSDYWAGIPEIIKIRHVET